MFIHFPMHIPKLRIIPFSQWMGHLPYRGRKQLCWHNSDQPLTHVHSRTAGIIPLHNIPLCPSPLCHHHHGHWEALLQCSFVTAQIQSHPPNLIPCPHIGPLTLRDSSSLMKRSTSLTPPISDYASYSTSLTIWSLVTSDKIGPWT